MNLSELKVLIIEDDPTKNADIMNALKRCGVQNMKSASYLEEALKIIKQYNKEGSPIGLIVTDMQYPLSGGFAPKVDDAGEQLIERLKEKSLDIPVIVCSSLRYSIPGILGCIWYKYDENSGLDQDFRRLLEQKFQDGGK